MPLSEPKKGKFLGLHCYPVVAEEGTLGDPETVIWSSIRQLGSRGVAEILAQKIHGIQKKRDQRAVANSVKLYLQQAWEFYQVARAAKPNTAPLIYYYSFLNLSKALCELKHPRLHRQPECYHHGLSWRPNPRFLVDLKTEYVSLTTRGVWHLLWEALTGTRCSTASKRQP